MEKGLLYITKKTHFNAAHKLYNPQWSQEKNEEVFGRCANANWHGHNFNLFVTIKGTVNQDTGFVMDLRQLKDLIEKNILLKVDHKNLNVDVPFFKDIMPSIENMVLIFWDILEKLLPENCQMHCIKLYETENNFVEYYG